MARRETPQETWERMRSGSRASAPPPDSPPPVMRAPAERRDAGQAAARADEGPPPARADEGPPPAQGREQSAPSPSASQETSAGELVKQLTDQTKTLVKQELRLAQTELQEKGKKVGVGAGMFGAGGLVAFFGAAVLIAAAVLALATALAPWLAALIVGVVLLAVAGVAAVIGKKKVQEATPPAPEQAIGSVKRDVDTVKRRARR